MDIRYVGSDRDRLISRILSEAAERPARGGIRPAATVRPAGLPLIDPKPEFGAIHCDTSPQPH